MYIISIKIKIYISYLYYIYYIWRKYIIIIWLIVIYIWTYILSEIQKTIKYSWKEYFRKAKFVVIIFIFYITCYLVSSPISNLGKKKKLNMQNSLKCRDNLCTLDYLHLYISCTIRHSFLHAELVSYREKFRSHSAEPVQYMNK